MLSTSSLMIKSSKQKKMGLDRRQMLVRTLRFWYVADLRSSAFACTPKPVEPCCVPAWGRDETGRGREGSGQQGGGRKRLGSWEQLPEALPELCGIWLLRASGGTTSCETLVIDRPHTSSAHTCKAVGSGLSRLVGLGAHNRH